jgi:hypothetical protein
MPLFKRKPDPLTHKSRTLNHQIEALEAQIRRLNEELEHAPHPRLRSTALPHAAAEKNGKKQPELIFEPLDQNRLTGQEPETPVVPEQFNELGARKFDFQQIWARFQSLFHGSTSSNPKLFKYLAAGNIQGLRPLRYEKRVARNRTILWILILFAVLSGIIAMLHPG